MSDRPESEEDEILPLDVVGDITLETIHDIAHGEIDCADEKLLRACRRHAALEYRVKGVEYREFAPKIGISKSYACEMVKRYMRQKSKDKAEALREIQNERLETLLKASWAKAEKGLTGAISNVLSIMERQNKLNGIEAPDVHEHVHGFSVTRRIIDPTNPEEPQADDAE